VLILVMHFTVDAGAERRLGEYFAEIGDALGHELRRESFAMYAMGLLGDGERKSAEPIAARACGDARLADAYHQRLIHFLGDSPWNDRDVRRIAVRYSTAAMAAREPVTAWIIDDTGFLKQGTHSVGVQRQYTGSAGKVTNCQVGVSLSIATRSEHVPADFELYLPESWANDPARRREGHIPDDVQFKTKPELALDMLRRAIDDELPRGIVMADAAYGNSSAFRNEIRWLGLDYAVGVEAPTKVWRANKLDCRYGDPISVHDLGVEIGAKRFRRVTWREGTKERLSSRFALRRVVPWQEDEWKPAEREAVWLLIEWPPHESKPTKFSFATLPPGISTKKLVRIVKERWRTERVYEDLKGELGLDHFEGRRFRGWHHHVSVALVCFSFIVAERVRRFSPQTRRHQGDDPLARPARAPLPRLLHHSEARYCSRHRHLAPPLPAMSPPQ
jgi:SRSO17 transposase